MLAKLTINTKIISLIVLLSVFTTGISVAGIVAMKSLNEMADAISVSGKQAVLGARIRQNVLALNRAEFRAVAAPTAENVASAKDVIEKQKAALSERLEKSRQLASAGDSASLQEIEAQIKVFVTALESDIGLVEELSTKATVNEEQAKVVAKLMENRANATKAEDLIGAFVDGMVKRNEDASLASSQLYNTVSMSVGAGAVICILLGLTLGLIVSQKGIVRPIRDIVSCLKGLASGDLSTSISGADRRDEIGEIGRTAQIFKENLIENQRMRAAQEAEQNRQIERGRQMEQAVSAFETVITEVVAVVSSAATELQATAQTLSATAEETAQQSTAVAAATEEMSQNVQTVASATEELSASISEISGQVTESTRIVGDAVTQANDTNAKVKSLSEAAQKIGEVVNLINDIAGQTNLLALNATIEAARAGEAGKGFAVVASEVKTLATQTSRATDEIAAQIRSIQDATDQSATAIAAITQTIGRVNEISTGIASAVEEQGAATQEISRNVQQAAAGSAEVSSNIVGVTQASQQTSAGSTQVLSSANELANNGERLKREVDTFLHKVRSL